MATKALAKKYWLILLTLLGFGAIYLASIWLARLTPESVLTNLFDMNEPTRYVFVADANQPRIAVIDLLAQQQTNTIVTKAIPEVLAINQSTAQLAYAEHGGQTVYLYDLSRHEEIAYPIDFAIQSMLFKPASSTLFIIGDKQILRTDSNDWSQQTRQQGLQDIKSVHYSPLSDELWLLDEGQGSIVGYQPNDDRVSTYPLPANWQHYSLSALSPDGEYLLFGVQNAENNEWLAVIWQTATQQVLTEQPISSSLLQPYIDVNSQHFVALDTKGQGLHFTLDNFDTPQIFQSIEQPSVSALGWMDNKLFVGGAQAVALHELNDITHPQMFSITSNVVDLFVTADSKTALFLLADSAALYGLDFHKGNFDRIDLVDIKQPSQLIMGAGHTLCH